MPRAAFSKTTVGRMLDESPQPAYLIDGRRRLVYANEALAKWLGVELASLSGLRCDYHSDTERPDKNAIVSVLTPPLQLLDGVAADALAAESIIRRPRSDDGATPAWKVQHCTLTDADGKLQGVLSVFGAQVASSSLEKEVTPAALHDAIAALRVKRQRQYHIDGLVGQSAVMLRVREQIALVSTPAAFSVRVLVTGPAGSGREHVARTIHAGRSHAEQPALVPLSCDLLDAELLQTTLTAFIQRCAELETEQPPSLLLLDVDQLSSDAQDELLGFLSIEEIGLRTIATSKTPLQGLIDSESFRSDLASHLATVEIGLSLLGRRMEDVPLLAQYYLEQYNAAGGEQRAGFAVDAIEQLVAYPWPGNVDELRNVVAACAASAAGTVIQKEELPGQIRLGMDAVLLPPETVETIDLEQVMMDFERDLITRALAETKQNKAEAARQLGLSRGKLLRRIAHLGLDA